MLTRAQVRQLVACPTCKARRAESCRRPGPYWRAEELEFRPIPNHRLRVRLAESKATELRKTR